MVAKCWDPNPKDYFSVSRTDPVRPIDPGAWVAHTAAVRGLEIPQYPGTGVAPQGVPVGGSAGVGLIGMTVLVLFCYYVSARLYILGKWAVCKKRSGQFLSRGKATL